LSAEKNDKLAKHLKDTDFFSVLKYPNVTVTVNGYNNGKLSTTINVMGKDVKQDIPVKLLKTESSVTISGKFDVDFSALKIEGMQPEKGSDEHVQSVIAYEMNLTLNKK
jgi:polyisoprenoid-binding protein YceI